MDDKKTVSEMDTECLTVGTLREVINQLGDEVLVTINGSPAAGMYTVTDYDVNGCMVRCAVNLISEGLSD